MEPLKRLDAAEELGVLRGGLRGRAACRLGVRHPVEVLQVEPADGGYWPRRLAQISSPFEREWGEQPAGELLVVQWGVTRGGPVCPAELGLGQDAPGIAA